jgi:hypothetical protein
MYVFGHLTTGVSSEGEEVFAEVLVLDDLTDV